MIFRSKPASRFTYSTLSVLSLLIFSIITANAIAIATATDSDSDSDSDFEELLAVDEEEKEIPKQTDSLDRLSDAEVLSKAQRIVLELNNDNFKWVIEKNEFLMVLGYAPWCARSAELMPQFAEAATSLKELGSSVLMAKVDADRYTKVASQLEIRGFPTLLLFTNGSSQAYTGGFSGEDIIIWARKKTGVPVMRINSVAEAERFLKKYHTFVVGLFKKFEGHDHEEFVKTATSDNEIQFVETNNIEIAKVLFPNIKATDSFVGIVKSEPEKYTAYEGAFEMEKMLQFLNYNKFPLVTKMTEINQAKVYSSPCKFQAIVFAKNDVFEKLLRPLEDVARKFKSEIMFVFIDITNDNLAKPFLSLLGLEDAENTVVTAFDNKISLKFLLEADPSPSNIEDFCTKLLSGTLSPYYKSQPKPDNKNATILAVVGKTFDDLVLSSPKNVVLEVYTPWCIACEATSKQVEKLAKHFKGLDSLVFARIDASANEHPKLQVEDYPTLLLYKADEKDSPVKLSTKLSSKDAAMFINKQLKSKDQVAKDEL